MITPVGFFGHASPPPSSGIGRRRSPGVAAACDRRMTNGVARSERAGERTAVHTQVLAGADAGMRADQERAGRTELLRGNDAARRFLPGLLLVNGHSTEEGRFGKGCCRSLCTR